MMKNILLYISIVLLSFCTSCSDQYLEIFPEDKITTANFPQNEADIKLTLNGVYALLRESAIYNEGLFGFGVLDGATPNAFNWGNFPITKLGNGQLSATDADIITFRWTRCYAIIFRANYLLKALEQVKLPDAAKNIYKGEAHFLRGLAYSLLADAYGGVPITNTSLSTDEAREIPRATKEATWSQVIADYDVAIQNLGIKAPEIGRADKGAALGLKMRAYLYQNNYEKVLEVSQQIEALNKYALFPSYEGLFKQENENNSEVLFDVQYISGENSQGSFHDQFCGTGTGSFTRGSRYVPTDNLVDAYETIDGSPVDNANKFKNRDPRLEFTVVIPGSYILGFRFPNYLYPGGAFNHPGNRLKHLSARKYRENQLANLPTSGQSAINNIVLRYADVLLAKAEALIELNKNIDEAIGIINRIRTERKDVKITSIPTGLSQSEARIRLRKERRIEFALEGLYWSDIKRWNIGKDIYPVVVKDHLGGVIETKFPNGYLDYYNLLPIPVSELSLNPKLVQNPKW
ncbi:RagB/SusD family nutrient uptake outer membrane protein [Aquirufa ecclesiirivi]|uniref:RagB/SusD family nutrient uptake outer membrane protein n=1 Tax=Aquirufa ecclesiirivi TaxID=2715124 RepID=UPI0023D87986|nr:RagB/SusD family nutrient uptake outer membrane protein [Aquirufa ecclesiirivi]MDF0693060.1 RagB/SusD family nutrient uptake outer membrane protein [Aquirufa ecclesiirivi]